MAGEYFDDKEIEEEELQEEDDDELEENFDDIKEIVGARNDLRSITYPIRDDLKERIGRLLYALFGDPRNPDAEGKLDLIEEELEYPNLRQHPIAKKIMSFIDDVRNLQRETKKLNKLDESTIKRMGGLLDKSLTLTVEGRKAEKEASVPDHTVTEPMVETFMKNWGDVLLEKYNEASAKRSYDVALRTRKLFIGKAETYFTNVHEESSKFGMDLLDSKANLPWDTVKHYHKKLQTSSEKSIPVEEGLSQQSALKKMPLKGSNQISEVISDDEKVQTKPETSNPEIAESDLDKGQKDVSKD